MSSNSVERQHQSMLATPVNIGNCVLIGKGVVVQNGSYIEDGDVNGANAVMPAQVENDALQPTFQHRRF